MIDAISDILTRIRNGYMARRTTVSVPWSKLKENLAKILVANGYLESTEVVGRDIVMKLKYQGKVPAVTEINQISKPSLRVYTSKDKLPRVLGGHGIAVLSTPRGLMTNREAGKMGQGGEVICEVW
jgi:small subunit ribosomal protein S8